MQLPLSASALVLLGVGAVVAGLLILVVLAVRRRTQASRTAGSHSPHEVRGMMGGAPHRAVPAAPDGDGPAEPSRRPIVPAARSADANVAVPVTPERADGPASADPVRQPVVPAARGADADVVVPVSAEQARGPVEGAGPVEPAAAVAAAAAPRPAEVSARVDPPAAGEPVQQASSPATPPGHEAGSARTVAAAVAQAFAMRAAAGRTAAAPGTGTPGPPEPAPAAEPFPAAEPPGAGADPEYGAPSAQEDVLAAPAPPPVPGGPEGQPAAGPEAPFGSPEWQPPEGPAFVAGGDPGSNGDRYGATAGPVGEVPDRGEVGTAGVDPAPVADDRAEVPPWRPPEGPAFATGGDPRTNGDQHGMTAGPVGDVPTPAWQPPEGPGGAYPAPVEPSSGGPGWPPPEAAASEEGGARAADPAVEAAQPADGGGPGPAAGVWTAGWNAAPFPQAVPPPQPDARDRLLAVLLDDPERAVGAAVELEACLRELDRLSDAVRRERAALRDVLQRLAAAGLRPDQLARLAAMPLGEVEEMLGVAQANQQA